ncbi:hypothetical protein FB639_004407, partial [Coemansia asiatica]
MSEEGEADFDAGQIDMVSSAEISRENRKDTANSKHEYQQRASSPISGSVARPDEPSAEVAHRTSAEMVGPVASYTESGNERHGDYEGLHESNGNSSRPRSPGWMGGSRSGRVEDESYFSGRRPPAHSQSKSKSRSRSGSRSRDYSRRSGYRGHHESSSSSRRGDYRADDIDSRDVSYRGGRYGDYGRSSYPRRYEREPPPSRYRRREPGRGPYSRPLGYSGSRDDIGEEDSARRDVDKEKAIEELRMRVRASHERLPQSTGSAPVRERSRSVTRPAHLAIPGAEVGAFAGTATQVTLEDLPVAAKQHDALTGEAPALLKNVATAIGSANVNIDDLEEGEHIEIEVETEKPAAPENTHDSIEPQIRGKNRGGSRSRSRTSNYSRDRASRERSPTPPGRSRSRAYYGSPSVYEQNSRRPSSYRDHAADSSDASYRRKYEEQSADRRDYRSRDGYRGRSSSRTAAYNSQYADAGGASYSSSRYSGARSPDICDNERGGYRSERRQYSGRYDRYYSRGADARSSSEYKQQYSPSSRHRPRSRSRSPPSLSSLHVSREDERRARQSSYGDRYHGYSSRPLSVSRSPRRHSRTMETDEPVVGASESANPPPPPPPLPHHGSSLHGQDPAGAYKEDSSYRNYQSSRSYRRSSRTPRLGSHGG